METITIGEAFSIKQQKSLITNVLNWIKSIFNRIKCKFICCAKSSCSFNEEIDSVSNKKS